MTAARSFELTGPEGTNPLGFLAALGALVALLASGERQVRLRWRRAHTWVPVIDGASAGTEADLARRIAAALQGSPAPADAGRRRATAQKAMEAAKTAVKRKHDEIRKRGLRGAEREEAIERELRPIEREYSEKRHQWLEALRAEVPRPELALGKLIDCMPDEYRDLAAELVGGATHAARDALDLLAAFGSDGAVARSAAIEATPFCFITGAGHQFFLETARELIGVVTAERVQQALFERWEYRDLKLSMRWDPVEDRRYALLDRDPTAADNKPRTVWMANALAYRALALFPSAPTRRGLAVTGWNLDERPPTFTWPLWEFPAGPDVVRTLLQLQGLTAARVDASELRARGVAAIYRSERILLGSAGKGQLNFGQARALA